MQVGLSLVQALKFFLDYVPVAGAFVAGAAILVMAVVIGIEVIARQGFDSPFIETVLLGKLAMVILTYLGVAWVFRQKRHVSVNIVVRRLPLRAQLWVEVIALSFTLLALGIAVYETWSFAHTALYLGEKLIGSIFNLPAFPFQVMIPIGLGLLCLEIIRRIAEDIKVLRRGDAQLLSLPQDTQG